MNIIFFSRREGRAKHFNLAHPLAVAAFSTVLVAILAAAFSLGLKIGEGKQAPRGVSAWSATLADQQTEDGDDQRKDADQEVPVRDDERSQRVEDRLPEAFHRRISDRSRPRSGRTT